MGDFSEGGFVEAGGDGVAFSVFLVAHLVASAVFGDGGSLGQTHADCADEDAFRGCIAGRGLGVILKVFAIRDDDDGTAFVLHPFDIGVAVAEGLHGFPDSVSDSGALGIDKGAVNLVEEELHSTIIVGERHLDIAASSEDHERDAVASQSVEEVLDGALATVETIGLDVFGHHAVGHVEAYGDVASWFTSVMYQSSAALVRNICSRRPIINTSRTFCHDTLDDGTVLNAGLHNLGGSSACTQIRGHQHYPGQSHTDPGPYWNWNYYYKLLNPNDSIHTLTASSGIFTDSGGASGNYSDNERQLTLIHSPGADSLVLEFSSFDLEPDYDFMWIYAGNNVFTPLLGRWNTQNPQRVVAPGEFMLVDFRSDCTTSRPGWMAQWYGITQIDTPNVSQPPATAICWNEDDWVTSDFTLSFLDSASTIQKSFFQSK
mgnify:CR=1 FL=1